MKALLFTILFSLLSSASTQVMVESITPLHTYNHKPSMKLKKQRQFRSLAKIKKHEAKEIAVANCHQDVKSYRLTHKRQLLLYRMYTKNCKIEINALDGAIISKVVL